MINNLRKAAFAGRNNSIVYSTANQNSGKRLKAVSNMGDGIIHDNSMMFLPKLMGVLSQENLQD